MQGYKVLIVYYIIYRVVRRATRDKKPEDYIMRIKQQLTDDMVCKYILYI